MRFTLISDVHVDMNPWDWHMLDNCDPQVPIVVAGDIHNDVFGASRWIHDLRARFDHVIWVMGNHDAYNLGFHQTRISAPQFESQWPYPSCVEDIYEHYASWSKRHHIHFLHRQSVEIQGVEFVGVTGWHNFDANENVSFEAQVASWQNTMNDSNYISWRDHHTKDPSPVLNAASEDAAYIRSAVRKNTKPKVVITHYVPHRHFLKVTGSPMWDLLNGSYFNSELESCVHESIQAWCFGHTHYRTDRDISGIRYVNNARGYRSENASWQPVEIEI